MIAMQYKISLPDDYPMDIIKKRVQDNGAKTDGFADLHFKAYLISEKGILNQDKNEYAPLYLWESSRGMNQFLFDGFYQNILDSFGWQKIQIGIVAACHLKKEFINSNYALEYEREIPPSDCLKAPGFSSHFSQSTGRVMFYHPDKWNCTEFHFFEQLPAAKPHAKFYRILHISM